MAIMELRNYKGHAMSGVLTTFVIILVTVVAAEATSSLKLSADTKIEISQGKLEGKILSSRDGREYLAFRNVPYASSKRFQNPTPPEKWVGVYNATEMGQMCAQTMWVSLEKSGEEDCLRLNVYTPKVRGKNPTMVYFHGGGFTIGTANYYYADYFMDEDVVLVTVNYRLGPFGFLSTADDIVPGNFGLKDQVMALKWVQKNIQKFGGDPDSVTIFGNSAGGASVNYHMLSPQSSGLFHAALSQSGSSLCPWASSPKPKYIAGKFGQALNCSVDSSRALLKCLERKSTNEILVAVDQLNEWGYDPFTPFGPTVESRNNPSSFISQHPQVLLKQGKFNKVPWMSGLVEDEGILMHSAYVLSEEKLTKEIAENWKTIFPITLEYNQVYTNWSETELDLASTEIYNYYFGNKSIGQGTRTELTNMYSDRFFNYGVKEAALLAAKHVPVYPYYFTHQRGDFTILEALHIEGNYGVSHADELSFLFSNAIDVAPDFKKGSKAEHVSKNLVKLWASFARHRKPSQLWDSRKSWTKAWNPISAAEIIGSKPLQYYKLDTETSLISEPFTKRLEFWTQLLTRLQLLSESDSASDPKDEL